MRIEKRCGLPLALATLYFLTDQTGVVFADSTIQIVVETEILSPDPKSGMKSRQLVQVNFSKQQILDTYETGTTDFFGFDLTSIRDNFRVVSSNFGSTEVDLKITGETASGARVTPNINYQFDLKLKEDGSASIKGCHDGYPAYNVIVEGKELYSFKHQPKDLLSLFGTCDVKVGQ